jgi:D-aminopeptidase
VKSPGFLVARSLCATLFVVTGGIAAAAAPSPAGTDRPRVREAGVTIGIFQPGHFNAITDVEGVKVGQVTITEGTRINTGVTAILPHGGNLYQDKVPAGFAVGNAFGKFAGSTQIQELGEIETPLLLTNTLSVPEAMAGILDWTLHQPGNEAVVSVNAVVGETNDAFLNDIRARVVTPAQAEEAITSAKSGPVEEGAVGAGRGTVAFGFKGGIGTSSRVLPQSLGGYTVGVLVQTNYGGVLQIAGVPVGLKLGKYLFKDQVTKDTSAGSCIVVIATGAPLSDRNLRRLAARGLIGIGRTGSPMGNGSGEYAVSFSTAESVRRTVAKRASVSQFGEVPNDQMTPLFEATVEAAEEAAIDSLFKAKTIAGYRGTVEALPLEKVIPLMSQHGDK